MQNKNNNLSSKVCVLRTSDYTNIKEKILKAFSYYGGINAFCNKRDNVLIKPNLLGPPKDENDPVITNPKLIMALVELLIDYEIKPSIGDSPAWSNPKAILNKAGIYEKLKKMNVDVINLNRADNKTKIYSHGKELKDYKLINLAKLKVHSQLGLTLSIKNLFGCISGKRKAILHMSYGDKENDFAEMLIRNYLDTKPIFTMVDGIIAMNKTGPIRGELKNTNLLFAGIDCVAIDRVIVECLDYTNRYRIIEAAKKLKVGVSAIDKIKVIGDGITKISLDYPRPMPISFSPIRIIKSIIKNAVLEKKSRVKSA